MRLRAASSTLALAAAMLAVVLQAVQEPDAGRRPGDRDGSSDAWKRQIPWLLPGDDLRRLSGGSEPGE